jgi:hypothetical protein
MNQDVIDREELIQYLTWLLDHDGELEKFYDRERLRFLVPDVLGLRDWLREQEFDTMIRDSYFKEYTKELYEDIGEYNPESFLHRHLNWDVICEEILDSDYNSVFDNDNHHPYNIFGYEFYYHI